MTSSSTSSTTSSSTTSSTSTSTKNPQIIGQGSYGCVYKPAIKCDGESGSEKYITKVQLLDYTAKNEISIAQKVKKMARFQQYFAPIEKTCPLNVAKVGKSYLEKCAMWDWDRKDSFVSNKIRYIGENTLHSGFLKYFEMNENIFEKVIVKTLMHLLHGLEKLSEKDIIHLDIKENNIMMKDNKPEPIIIDFGLSFDKTSFQEKEVFFDYIYDYSPWGIEQAIIGYKVHHIEDEKSEIKQAAIDRIFKDYETSNPTLKDSNATVMKNYKNMKKYFSSFVGKKWAELSKEIYKESWSWDIHGLFITYVSYLTYDKTISERHHKLIKFIESHLYIPPSERKNHGDLIKELEELYSIKEKRTPIAANTVKKSIDKIQKKILTNRITELRMSQKLRERSSAVIGGKETVSA